MSGVNFPLLELSSLLLLSNDPVEAVWNRITLTSMTGSWYLRLTQYEIIFLKFAVFQLFLLRYVEILPLSLNGLFGGDPAGKRRRRRSYSNPNIDFEGFSRAKEELLSIILKLDDRNCFLLSLCELSNDPPPTIPNETRLMLQALKRLGRKRIKMTPQKNNTMMNDPGSLLSIFEEAALYGFECQNMGNEGAQASMIDSGVVIQSSNEILNTNITATPCELRYALCPLTRREILGYLEDVWGDFLS